MIDSAPQLKSERPFFLVEYFSALLLLTVALFFASVFGVGAILAGKSRFFFSYWQCLPCFILLLACGLLPKQAWKATSGALPIRLLLAAAGLTAFSPFATWMLRSNGNLYFDLCCVLTLAMALWTQLEICQLMQKLAKAGKVPSLAFSALKTRFLVLCFEIIPVCAVYGSGILARFIGTNQTVQDIFRIWHFGKISLLLRFFLFWGLLQVLILCLYATWLAAQQLKKLVDVEQQ
ncbi:MAG: hypothetical protein WCT05_05290 [Lentisphaeria bacterium]